MPVLTLHDSNPLTVRAKALVFEDPNSQALLDRIRQVAPSDATVLVTGETGTGKEIVARQIHTQSQRRDRPFVAMNCGALAASVAESELFGHEKGSFTGATNTKIGWFEAANGGTLFLDEIGDLPLPLQVKLLRVLQEGEVVRVGARQPISVDVRLIAATNVNLDEAVAAGHFREDLYYRLNVVTLSLPPLRERPGDILPLARYFLGNYAHKLQADPKQFSPGAELTLLAHSWPGNIRELENVVHHALLIGQGKVIEPRDLRLSVRPERVQKSPTSGPDALANLRLALLALYEQQIPNLSDLVEEVLMGSAFDFCERNQVQTARLLGISRNIVRARLIDYGIIAGSVRPPPPTTHDVANVVPMGRPVSSIMSKRHSSVRIGYQRFGLLPAMKVNRSLDEMFGVLGFRVDWIEYPGGLQLIESFQKDRLSLAAVGEGPPVIAQANELPFIYVAAEAAAPEDEAIVVPIDSSIHFVSELRGKTIALNRGANVHYLLIRALEEVGLDYDDTKVLYLPPTDAQEAFFRKTIDAWGIWSPLLGDLVLSGHAREIVNGLGITDNAVHYIAGAEFSERHPELIELFMTQLTATAKSVAPHRVPRRIDESLLEGQQRVADAFHRHRLIPREIHVNAQARWRGNTIAVRTLARSEPGMVKSGC
jgi:DNA-binding NtrC family response regulator/ABC-type nitrate/sulfonate/bicarbonate transport system substrate-binding protein